MCDARLSARALRVLGLVLGVAALLAARPALACTTCTPGIPVPQTLWGQLQPVDSPASPLPSQRDSTLYTGQVGQFPDSHLPLFTSLDIEGNYAFVSYTAGFEIWNITNPNSISRSSLVDGWRGDFLGWPGYTESRWLIWDVAAPAGNTNLIAVAGYTGLSVWDVTNKSQPKIAYQDGMNGQTMIKLGQSVWSANIGGRNYAFFGVPLNAPGLYIYDMTQALTFLPGGCLEDTTQAISCPGVYKGKLGTDGAFWVDGIQTAGGRTFVAYGTGLASGDVQIWDVTTPTAPQLVVRFLSGSRPDGAAFWHDSGRNKDYLGVRTTTQGQIYDVTTCLDGNGCTAGQIQQTWATNLAAPIATDFVTFSRGGSTPYLYFGTDDKHSAGLQREFVYDVSDPSGPVEISPHTTHNVGGNVVDYWGYYYEGNASGFNQVMPRVAMFKDNYLYRAAWTIFDVHQLVNVQPAVGVSGPATGYAGDPLTFTATASNCTPSPTGWTWTTGGGSGASSTSSIAITWSSTGVKTVTAKNSACVDSNQQPVVGSTTTTIVDPAPAVQSATASPSSAPVCSAITFTANGATGEPPLTYAWSIRNSDDTEVGSGSGNPFVWGSSGQSPGTYHGVVTVSGPGGPDATATATLNLIALPPLSDISNETPTAVITSNFVTFSVPAGTTGATQWEWNFGDGPPVVYTDPVVGPHPTHTYQAVGDYNVTVRISNCNDTQGSTSLPLQVHIESTAPLEAHFQATCPLGVCAFGVGTVIPFVDTSGPAGAVTHWYYAWNNTSQTGPCTGYDTGHTSPLTTHAYASTGTYYPCLRVEGSGEPNEYVHPRITITTGGGGGGGGTPSITVSGPSTGSVNQASAFSATATNCTPSGGNATGWSWDTGGGSGASNTSTIQITWSTAGTKTVRATNSGCGSAFGSKAITISDGGSGSTGDGPQAAFTFTPASPNVGQQVSFNGSTSTGSISTYSWDFGDGGTGSGVTASHAFTQAGSHSVKLTVWQGCPSPSCFDHVTHTVTVGGSQTGACSPGPETICLLGGRFSVDVHYHDQHNGGDGDGQVMTFPTTDQSGAFWFFNPSNAELLVKMVDGTTVNGHYWVFYGALTDVEYWLTVTDTEDPTHPVEYHNVAGNICGVGDTAAFPASGGTHGSSTAGPMSALDLGDLGPVTGASGTCLPSDGNLCLLDGRFSVEVSYHDQHNDQSGDGTAVSSTDQTGFFWFFNPANYELVVKMVDGTTVNGHYWVFWGSLSDVEYTLHVTDTVTSHTWQVTNTAGNICGGANTSEF